jgi:hypothetical protein
MLGPEFVLCADCGRPVAWMKHYDTWAEPIECEGRVGWSATCRHKIEGDRLLSADYHYVDGETQRYFRAPEETSAQ